MLRFAIVAVICSIVLPFLAFTAYTTLFSSIPFSPEPMLWAGRVLDFPVAAFNRLLPESLRTHYTWSLTCNHTYCFPRSRAIERTHYQVVGAAAYLALFAIAGLAYAAVKQ